MTMPVAVGIVGVGAIAYAVHLPVLKNIPGVRVAWVADVDERTANEAGAAFGVQPIVLDRDDPVLPACDVALLATPLFAREAYLAQLAERRVPVLVEKPFAVTAQQHQLFLDWFRNTPIACGYMRRTHAAYRGLRRVIAEDWFGPVQRIQYAEGARASKTGFGSSTLDLSFRQGGGVLRDLGCHGIDTIGYITGAHDFAVEHVEIAWDGETDRHVSARFQAIWQSGARTDSCPVDYTVSWLADQPNQIVVEFERVILRSGIKPDAKLCVAGTGSAEEAGYALTVDGAQTSYQSFYLEWTDFLQALPKQEAGELAAASSFWTTQVVDAIYAKGERS